jgi:hypothetical protein
MRSPIRLAGFAAIVAAVCVAACADAPTAPTAAAEPPAPAEGVLVYLALSSLAPQPGDRLTVTVRALRGADAEAIGSFTLRLAFDTAALRLSSSEPSREGLVMANVTGGVMTIAGASGDGFHAGALATLTMEVVHAGALPSLALTVEEINATSFRDERARTRVDRTQYRQAMGP